MEGMRIPLVTKLISILKRILKKQCVLRDSKQHMLVCVGLCLQSPVEAEEECSYT